MKERKTPLIKFVNFHGHSNASIFDGLGYPHEHLEFAYNNGVEALALTDHGNMNNLPYQIFHAKKMNSEGRNIKPLYGVEAYFTPSVSEWEIAQSEWAILKKTAKEEDDNKLVIEDDSTKGELDVEMLEDDEEIRLKRIIKDRRHLVLLAMNQEGLNNIFSLVSLSHTRPYFYKFPRVDYEALKKHSKGVLATSSCLGGIYAGDMWGNRDKGPEAVLEAMRYTTKRMLDIFGDNWYGEIQWNYIKEQHELNQYVIQVCDEFGVEIISTADAHFPSPERWKDRELYKRLGWKTGDSPIPDSVKELGYNLYPKNGDEMFKEYYRTSRELGFEYDDDFVLQTI